MRYQISKQAIIDLFIHLRLHYQLLLAPIFVWGYFLTDHRPDADFWLAFLSFHIFLYGGGTAFNSYYDRDEGPVGGLAHPPPVSQILLPFSLLVLSLGVALAALINLYFLFIYLIMFGLGLMYSLPAIRLKGRPLMGLATVAIGQGILASLGGWVVANPNFRFLESIDIIAILAVTLVTVGFYPLTQIYQIAEDLERGDVTFAAWVGPAGTFIFTIIVQLAGVILMMVVINQLLGLGSALLVGGFYGALLAGICYWAFNYDNSRVLQNFKRIMVLNALTSLGFLGFLSVHLFNIV